MNGNGENMIDLEYDLDLAAEFGSGFMPESDDDGIDFEATAKNLSKMGYQKIVWHDAKKELPDGNWYILGYDYYGQTYAVVSWDGTDWSDDNGMCYNVDYWAELPEIEVEK